MCGLKLSPLLSRDSLSLFKQTFSRHLVKLPRRGLNWRVLVRLRHLSWLCKCSPGQAHFLLSSKQQTMRQKRTRLEIGGIQFVFWQQISVRHDTDGCCKKSGENSQECDHVLCKPLCGGFMNTTWMTAVSISFAKGFMLGISNSWRLYLSLGIWSQCFGFRVLPQFFLLQQSKLQTI